MIILWNLSYWIPFIALVYYGHPALGILVGFICWLALVSLTFWIEYRRDH
jgi:hypothetical protein